MVEVLLDDEPAPHRPAGPESPRRWWLLAVAALLVAVAGASQLVLDGLERARRERLAGITGVVDPVGDRLAVLWRTEGSVLGADGTTVVLSTLDDDAITLHGVDRRTGRARWSTPLLRVRSEADDVWWPTGCVTTPADLLACLVTDRVYSTISGASREPTTTRLVVLDPADGSLEADLEVAGATSLAAVGDVVALTRPGSPGRVLGFSPSGSALWAAALPEPLSSDSQIMSVHGAFAVVDAFQTVTFVDPSGDVGRRWIGGELAGYLAGELVAMDERGTTLIRPDGDVEVPGPPVQLAVDDGSAPLTFAQVGPDVVALSADLVPQWSVTAVPGYRSAVLLRGVVYLATGPGVWTYLGDPPRADARPQIVAVDASDGHVLWRSEPDTTPQLLTTDGRTLIGVEEEGLSRWRLSDGAALGTVALPDEASSLDLYDSFLAGWDTQGRQLLVVGTP